MACASQCVHTVGSEWSAQDCSLCHPPKPFHSLRAWWRERHVRRYERRLARVRDLIKSMGGTLERLTHVRALAERRGCDWRLTIAERNAWRVEAKRIEHEHGSVWNARAVLRAEELELEHRIASFLARAIVEAELGRS